LLGPHKKAEKKYAAFWLTTLKNVLYSEIRCIWLAEDGQRSSTAEQRFCKPQVVSSTLTAGSKGRLRRAGSGGEAIDKRNIGLWQRNPSGAGQIPEWPKGPDCKSGGTAFAGSNPALPTTPLAGLGWPEGCCPKRKPPGGRSSTVEPQPSKLVVRVRFPSPAPGVTPHQAGSQGANDAGVAQWQSASLVRTRSRVRPPSPALFGWIALGGGRPVAGRNSPDRVIGSLVVEASSDFGPGGPTSDAWAVSRNPSGGKANGEGSI
jgi:hypothetical protein